MQGLEWPNINNQLKPVRKADDSEPKYILASIIRNAWTLNYKCESLQTFFLKSVVSGYDLNGRFAVTGEMKTLDARTDHARAFGNPFCEFFGLALRWEFAKMWKINKVIHLFFGVLRTRRISIGWHKVGYVPSVEGKRVASVGTTSREVQPPAQYQAPVRYPVIGCNRISASGCSHVLEDNSSPLNKIIISGNRVGFDIAEFCFGKACCLHWSREWDWRGLVSKNRGRWFLHDSSVFAIWLEGLQGQVPSRSRGRTRLRLILVEWRHCLPSNTILPFKKSWHLLARQLLMKHLVEIVLRTKKSIIDYIIPDSRKSTKMHLRIETDYCMNFWIKC